MEFLAYSILGLIFLFFASVALVEGAYLLTRFCSRVSFWFRYRYPTWRSGRYVARLKRKPAGLGTLRPSLGQLRFTKHRAEQFKDGE
jgi:hypothetical protein